MLHTLCMAICSNIIDCKYDKTPFFTQENLLKLIITFLSFIIFRCILSLSLPLVNELICFFPNVEKDFHSKYIDSMNKAIICDQVIHILKTPTDKQEFLSLNKQQLSLLELEQACAVFVQGIPVNSFSLSEAEFQNCIFNGNVNYSNKVYTTSRGYGNIGIFKQRCESFKFNEYTIPFTLERAGVYNLNLDLIRTQLIDFVITQRLQKNGFKEVQAMADHILSLMEVCNPDAIMSDACDI
ncbi:MAG: hypothetical protein EOP34_02240 [Rickettsiales bacterium]|nr:MAG: hypothetical protein EOP34_02240 [Rickettsiales bacterium]